MSLLIMSLLLMYGLITSTSIFIIVPTNLLQSPNHTPHVKRILYRILTINYKFIFVIFMLGHVFMANMHPSTMDTIVNASNYYKYFLFIGLIGVLYLVLREVYTNTTMVKLLNIEYSKLLYIKNIKEDIHRPRKEYKDIGTDSAVCNHINFIFSCRWVINLLVILSSISLFCYFSTTILNNGEINRYISKYYPGFYQRSSTINISLEVKLALYKKIKEELAKFDASSIYKKEREEKINRLLNSVEDTVKNNKSNDNIDIKKILNGQYDTKEETL